MASHKSERSNPAYDLVLAGGGLANGLLAYRLKEKWPALKVLIVEKGAVIGGQHTWSFHTSDITAGQYRWLEPLISRKWRLYDVRFPLYTRTIVSGYNAIQSQDFHKKLTERLKDSILLNQEIRDVFPTGILLANGERIRASAVLDGRGWTGGGSVSFAYQKFLGLHVTLNHHHDLRSPVLMDATVPQDDGYRFIYILPWSDKSLLIEDTYYSETAQLDFDRSRQRIRHYAQKRGWEINSVDREENGVLPIPLDGDLPAWDNQVACTGAKAGLFHATTGYSLPSAVRFADEIAKAETFDPTALFERARSYCHEHWTKEAFCRFLNRLMFRAAKPADRYKVLQKFYRHPDTIVARFYAGNLRTMDKARLFSGRPPVSLTKAVQCILLRRLS